MTKETDKIKYLFGLSVHMIRIHYSRAKTGQQEELRAHILICSQESRVGTLRMMSLLVLKAPTDAPPPMKPHLLIPSKQFYQLRNPKRCPPPSLPHRFPPSIPLPFSEKVGPPLCIPPPRHIKPLPD